MTNKKLKKYDVVVKVDTEYVVIVEAENEEEAKTQALMTYDYGVELTDKDNTRVIEIELRK